MDDGTRGLRLTNTLTRQKEELRPLDWADSGIPDADKRVRVYVCGPTVYDYAHIGNARPVIVFDVLFRLLRHLYGAERVTYVRNITDVDDKIIARAAEEHPGLPLNQAIRKVTEATERQFHADAAALGCLEPTHEPRATEHIDRMKAMIDRLIAKGNAYVAEEHALFHVPSMPDYGRLSGRTLDEMVAGARVEVAPYKRDPMDFVLWKPSKQGEPAWPSPAGIATPGRPGWHIECSAMAEAFLGPVFDIHGGGVDLVFPHHENELAQSRCAHGTDRMAQIWMHNGYLQVEGAKMSKSAGNFVTVRDLLRGWCGEPWSGSAIRLAMLMTHYRQPLDWTHQRLVEAKASLGLLASRVNAFAYDSFVKYQASWSEPLTIPNDVSDALLDDLNTPLAANLLIQAALDGLECHKLIHMVRILGLFSEGQESFLTGSVSLRGEGRASPEAIHAVSPLAQRLSVAKANDDAEFSAELQGQINDRLFVVDENWTEGVHLRYNGPEVAKPLDSFIAARAEARRRKDWAEADRIRDELDRMGITLKDSKDPETGELVTTWELKR